MNDEVAMRVLHGGANPAEQFQATLERQATLVAVAVDRYALDVLHREPRHAVRGHSPVEEAGDVPVVERREDLSLLDESADETLLPRAPPAQQLEGYTPLVLVVGALGEVDDSHPPVPDLSEDAVGADGRAGGGRVEVRPQLPEKRRGKLHRGSLKEGRRVTAREQRRYFGAQRLVTGARLLDVGGALVRCQLERPVDDVKDLPPPRGGRQSGTRGVLPQTSDIPKMRAGPGRRKLAQRILSR